MIKLDQLKKSGDNRQRVEAPSRQTRLATGCTRLAM